MRIKFAFLLFFIGASFLASANTKNTGEEAATKTDIAGSVFQHLSKKPLGSVTVTVYSAAKKEKVVYTNDGGWFVFDDLKAGTYRFVFEKDGYKKVTKEKVLVRPNEGVQLNIEMTAHASFDFMPGPFHFSDFE